MRRDGNAWAARLFRRAGLHECLAPPVFRTIEDHGDRSLLPLLSVVPESWAPKSGATLESNYSHRCKGRTAPLGDVFPVVSSPPELRRQGPTVPERGGFRFSVVYSQSQRACQSRSGLVLSGAGRVLAPSNPPSALAVIPM
jgi:hypothetical protein